MLYSNTIINIIIVFWYSLWWYYSVFFGI